MSTQDTSRLAHMPPTFFIAVMGLSGSALALYALQKIMGGDVTSITFTVLAALSSFAFVLTGLFYIAKTVRHLSSVLHDFTSPASKNLMAAIPISFLLQAMIYQTFDSPISFWLWSIGSVLQLGIALYTVSGWFWQRSNVSSRINPTWLMPVVGMMLISVVGTPYASLNVLWLFFATGLFFIVPLYTLMMRSALRGSQMPQRMRPSYTILIVPFMIGSIALTHLMDGDTVIAQPLYLIGIFITLLLLVNIKRIVPSSFSLAWWTYVFPLASGAIASSAMYTHLREPAYAWITFVFAAATFTLATITGIKTIVAIMKRQICQPET